MSSVVHCLGELEHIYDKHNLKLRTNAYLTLSSPQSSNDAFSTNLQDLDALISSGTWIAGANRLRLHVELLFDDIAISGSSVSQATEDIGIVLCNAELWSQLCLDASLAINDSNKCLITLSSQASSNVLIRPLTCTPSACLEEISMTFHFSTCRRTRNVSESRVTSGIQHTSASTNPTDEHLNRRYYSLLSSSGGCQGVLDNPMDGYARCILGAPSVSTSPMSSQGGVSSNTHISSSLDTPITRPRYATQEVKFEVLVQLVDSSLRRMMSDCKPVRPGGVVLSSDAGCPKLAAISPALFSPGHFRALSQRTALPPMIVRSICRLYRRTNSNRLRYKLQQLQELSLSGSLDHGSTEDSDSFSTILSSSVEARLWFLTRSKLIDPFACRGLKSLNTAHNTCFGSHEMLDEPLDDAGDLLLGGDETPILDAYGAAMELGETDDLDLFQEHCLSGIADEGEELLDGDLFWEHSQDEVAYDQVMLLNDDTSTLMSDDSHAKIFGALAFESGNDGVR